MVRTLNALRLIVIGMALLLAVLAAPAGQAQSVKGSATIGPLPFNGLIVDYRINVYIRTDGRVGGSITNHYLTYDGYKYSRKYRALSLIVIGNQATVTAQDQSTFFTETFTFTDNGDGSVTPDLINSWPISSGDITVSP